MGANNTSFYDPRKSEGQRPASSRNDEEVLSLIERYLEPNQPSDYRLVVSRQSGLRREGNWLYAVVQPTGQDVRASDYNARLETTEEALERDERLKVLLVPILPE